MAEPLKDIYNGAFFETFTQTTSRVIPGFDKTAFLKEIYHQDWEESALKQRIRHIAVVLSKHLPNEYDAAITIIIKMIDDILLYKGGEGSNFPYTFFADYVEVYGLEEYDISVYAMENITQFVSCEFAVRPFILKYPEKMIPQMINWSTHPHSMVRRLASEGCRPRLPWGTALSSFKKDPTPILPILNQLKNDSSESVRRSVANNLNDISKDNPAIIIDLVQKWKGQYSETDWVVKHACRTLLKQGNETIMQLFGFGSLEDIKINNFKIQTPRVSIGDYLVFSFMLENKGESDANIRLEYGIYYLKANGSLSRKVFKISEKTYPSNTSIAISRRQSFKIITTRKYYTGHHQVALIMNGKEADKLDFELVEAGSS